MKVTMEKSDKTTRHSVGLDIGAGSIRCVIASVDHSGNPTIVGYKETPNSGMRKGVVVNVNGPAKVIDDTLGEVERMSGSEVNEAVVSVNGSHILSTKTDGMIAVGSVNHEINNNDLDRVEEVATLGKIPANREILELVPYNYRLDGQGGIKDPIGMTGTRLEIKANVVSALMPYCDNVRKTTSMADVKVKKLIVSAVAAARAVLSERQMENGVAVIDFGSATTGIAIYEEGDLQFASVIPVGSDHLTNDLAMGLQTSPDIADIVKRRYASAKISGSTGDVTVKLGKDDIKFNMAMIEEIVNARLDE